MVERLKIPYSLNKSKFFYCDPVPKPRMTRRDQFFTRPIVARYWAFKQEILLGRGDFKLPQAGAHILFVIPTKIKDRWRQKHQLRPDLDNYLKGLFDALEVEDCAIWDIQATKIWGERGRIEIHSKHD